MRPHCWIEFKGKTKVAFFVVAVIGVIAFAASLPHQAWTRTYGRRGVPPLPVVMLVLWTGGLFTTLFLKAEDLNVLAPFNFQSLYRWTGIVAAFAGVVFGGIIYLRFLS
jgi:hypothetical protein